MKYFTFLRHVGTSDEKKNKKQCVLVFVGFCLLFVCFFLLWVCFWFFCRISVNL